MFVRKLRKKIRIKIFETKKKSERKKLEPELKKQKFRTKK